MVKMRWKYDIGYTNNYSIPLRVKGEIQYATDIINVTSPECTMKNIHAN